MSCECARVLRFADPFHLQPISRCLRIAQNEISARIIIQLDRVHISEQASVM